MTLPGLDLTPLVTAINSNTAMLQNVVDELVRMNEDKDTKLDDQVKDIREVLENRYKARIELLESRLPQNANPIPHGWTDRGPGDPSGGFTGP